MIEGARRIGKSTTAEEFARNEYRDYLILDFALEPDDVKRLFTESLGNMASFFRQLFVLKGKTLPERESLIILDEIQMFPEAQQAIRHLDDEALRERITAFARYADLGIEEISKVDNRIVSLHSQYDSEGREVNNVTFSFLGNESEGTIKYFSLSYPIIIANRI